MAELQIIIVTYNSEGTIEGCLADVLAAAGSVDHRETVVDNASSDGTVEIVGSGFPEVEVVPLQTNIGFGAANNAALRQSDSPFALLLNPDTRIAPEAVTTLMKTLKQHPRVALVGPQMQYPDGSPQVSFGSFPGLFGDIRQSRLARGCRERNPRILRKLVRRLIEPFSPDWISGSCFLARTQALREIDYFDTNFFLYMEDIDLCRRLKTAGWRVMVEPSALCLHHEGGSQPDSIAMKKHFRRSRLLYINKHGGRFGFMFYKLLRARGIGLKWDPQKRFRSWRRV
ncbi:MAG TPA: glycosyltransferase family 2 protein [Acidobacteriota bacterium]|nr:glycosyltransferase family 2 protein [Acidobacteriota bacterium]